MDKIITADYLLVPGGEFLFGTDEPEYDTEREVSPQIKLNIPSFRIKRTVVTVKEWKIFLNDSQYAWDDWENVALTSPTANHPIVFVSWHDAHAYCEWGSRVLSQCMRLPTEFEWQKACRGDHGQLYPVEIDGQYDKKVYDWGELLDEDLSINRIVGRDPTRKTPYGLLDIWESVSEWCENWWEEYLGERLLLHNGDVEKVLAETAEESKTWHGGRPYGIGCPRCTKRGNSEPSYKHGFLGFRPVLCSG